MLQEMVVDLRRPPSQRWQLTPEQQRQARDLFRVYKADLGLKADTTGFLASVAKDLIRRDHWMEMESLAAALELPVEDAILCNLYYDALKVTLGGMLGCTAFAVDTPDGVLHARNLDWWSEEAALTRYTSICRFEGAPAGEFLTIGWPGFVGAFSGLAPGRFAITLNAVLSEEPLQAGPPVVFLLRSVLEDACSFDEAQRILSETTIPCDCLLLLSGVRPGEMAVIERTPSRHAIRSGGDGYVCVTNGYQALKAGLSTPSSGLLATWCQRFQRIDDLVRTSRPETAGQCLAYLSDPDVRMNITVQQMVFQASTGRYWMTAVE